MDKLIKLISLCKASVSLEANAPRDYYETIEYFLEENNIQVGKDISKDVQDKMIELNTIISVQFYPHTPIGFYKVYHYDVNLALDKCLEIMDNLQD